MKQPEDFKTLELPIEAKRGRGRPAKADALTQAERAKRYRANKKQNPVIKSDVTEINNEWANERERELGELRHENHFLMKELTKITKEYEDFRGSLTMQDDLPSEERLVKEIGELKSALEMCLHTVNFKLVVA